VTEQQQSAVWIKTEPTVDGSAYVVTIEASQDRSTVLTPDRALRYASTILGHVARAEYDAAVVRQLGDLIEDRKALGQMLTDLRQDRPPIDDDATAPLSFEGGVSAFTGNAFLHIAIDGRKIGQWDIADAKAHALGVLEAVSVADLDSGYYRVLRGMVGLDEGRARQIIGDLGKWRVE
jgi:hypothetical protein